MSHHRPSPEQPSRPFLDQDASSSPQSVEDFLAGIRCDSTPGNPGGGEPPTPPKAQGETNRVPLLLTLLCLLVAGVLGGSQCNERNRHSDRGGAGTSGQPPPGSSPASLPVWFLKPTGSGFVGDLPRNRDHARHLARLVNEAETPLQALKTQRDLTLCLATKNGYFLTLGPGAKALHLKRGTDGKFEPAWVESAALQREIEQAEYLSIDLTSPPDQRRVIDANARGPPATARKVVFWYEEEKVPAFEQTGSRTVFIRTSDLPAALKKSPIELLRLSPEKAPSPLEQLLVEVDRALSLGMDTEASGALGVGLAIDKDHPLLLYRRALIELRRKRPDQVRNTLSTLAEKTTDPGPLTKEIERRLESKDLMEPERGFLLRAARIAQARDLTVRKKTAATVEPIVVEERVLLQARLDGSLQERPAAAPALTADCLLYVDDSAGLGNRDFSATGRHMTIQQAISLDDCELIRLHQPDPIFHLMPDVLVTGGPRNGAGGSGGGGGGGKGQGGLGKSRRDATGRGYRLASHPHARIFWIDLARQQDGRKEKEENTERKIALSRSSRIPAVFVLRKKAARD